MNTYGKELILDLHDCNKKWFTKKHIEQFMVALCYAIGMEREELHFWVIDDPKQPDHLIGTSACQFIRTSNVTIHTLVKLKKVFLNIFSCKDFDENKVVLMAMLHFSGTVKNRTVVERD